MANRIILNQTSYHGAGADYLIAIGGGSPMDTSKAIGIAHSMTHTLGAVYDTPHGVACARSHVQWAWRALIR